jgi:hypothetical protein
MPSNTSVTIVCDVRAAINPRIIAPIGPTTIEPICASGVARLHMAGGKNIMLSPNALHVKPIAEKAATMPISLEVIQIIFFLSNSFFLLR